MMKEIGKADGKLEREIKLPGGNRAKADMPVTVTRDKRTNHFREHERERVDHEAERADGDHWQQQHERVEMTCMNDTLKYVYFKPFVIISSLHLHAYQFSLSSLLFLSGLPICLFYQYRYICTK